MMSSISMRHVDGILDGITMYDTTEANAKHIPRSGSQREFISVEFNDGTVRISAFLSVESAIELRDQLVAMELALPEKEAPADACV